MHSTGSPQPIVSLSNVSKLFGTVAALRSVSCDLDAGHGYLVLGANGAGKSTLLRIVAGLAETSSGKALAFGQPPRDVRQRIGYMSHETMLYDELTAAENLSYFASLYPDRHCMTAGEALRAVGLRDAPRLRVGQYSQGMRQRVSLARALMTRPDLLLLDEPFSNMDRVSALSMIDLLTTLKQNGCTLLLTTHQAELAVPLADTTWHLRNGALDQQSGNAA